MFSNKISRLKNALPLFFLAVKTNVGFSVVAEIVVQNKTKEAIKQQGLKNKKLDGRSSRPARRVCIGVPSSL